MSNEITTVGGTDLVDQELFSGASVFDIERFEQIMRVATVMARATTIPEHLKGKSNNADERYEETRGNCFMICNQSANWGMDPFAVAQASSFVFGKIVLEGKLVRAVIRKKLGFDLNYRFFGNPGDMSRRVYVSEQPLVDNEGNPLDENSIKALMERPASKITTGTLAKWHTKNKNGGVNDNWAKDEEKMFRERGAREWCREWVPGLMLGVYTPDEFDEIEHSVRSNKARDITHNPLLDGGRSVAMETIDPKTGEILNSEVQRETTAKTTSSAKAASAKPASDDAGRGGGDSQADSRPNNSSSQGSDPLPSKDDDQTGSQGSPQPRLSVDQFRHYASALARMQSTENVQKADKQFWAENGGVPAKGSPDYLLGAEIYKKQMDRAKGLTDADGLLDELHEAIDASFGADKFPGDL